jgi:diacylglycerol kinase (ATP)
MSNSFKGKSGFARVLLATGYSLQGLRSAYIGENAFRQEVWCACLMLPTAFWLSRGWMEMILLVASVIFVLIVELLNSGIEAAIDRISFDVHELSKRAKDQASAAVFLSVLLCLLIWGTVIFQRFMV